MGSEYHSGGFLKIRKFSKKFQFDPLYHVATLTLNVAMLALNIVTLTESRKIKPLSRRDVGSQRHDVGYPYFGHPLERRDVSWHHSLECRDVGFQHHDVRFIDSLACRDVGSERRNVATSPFWNVATLSPNVATLPLFYAQQPSVFFPKQTLSLSSQIP